MNLRGLYKWAGVCAIGYAIIALSSYAAWISSSGFLAVTATPPTPDRIVQMAQQRGNEIAAQLDLLAYFLWIPSWVGIFVFLRSRTPGRALVGGAFGAFALLGFLIASVLNAFMISLVQASLTDALKDRLVAFFLLSNCYLMVGLWGVAATNLLWGLAFRTQAGLAKSVGNLFLTQLGGFVIAFGGFWLGQDLIGNTGILIQTLALAATYVSAGMLLAKASQETEIEPGMQERSRAAGASA